MVRLPRNFFDDAAPFRIDGVYCKLIPLTRGQFALVFKCDYRWLSRYLWNASWNRATKSFYAVRYAGGGRKNTKHISMHRQILGLPFGDDLRTGDHVDPKRTLDNRRDNLRVATPAQQQHNKCRQANNTSGFKGVTWHCVKRKWMAQIKIHGKQTYLGLFATPEAAHRAYCQAAYNHNGQFARTA